jgi:hypothetical protein
MLPFARLLNLIWYWRSRGASQEDRAKLETALDNFTELYRHTHPARPGTALEQRRHHAGLAPPNIRPPSWWRGDDYAFRSSVKAMGEVSRADATGGTSLGRQRQPRARPSRARRR